MTNTENIIKPSVVRIPMALVRHRYTGVEYETITRYSVTWKDVFSIEMLYTMLHEWLVDNRYAEKDDSKFPEVLYLQKEEQKGKEIWIRWRPSRFSLSKRASLFRFDIDIDIHLLGLKEVELLVKGKKITAEKGEVEVNVVANLVKDPEGKWKKHSILGPLRELYIRRIIRQTKRDLEDELYNDAMRMREAITSYLNVEAHIGLEKEARTYFPKID